MGILNLSPDSFSRDGLGNDMEAIVNRAKCLVADGADIVDIGGESTRPGSSPLLTDEEQSRVIPVIERLAGEISLPLSIDTYKSEVARQAVKAGAGMINDVWGLKRDPDLAQVASGAGVPIVLVSNKRGSTTRYDIMVEVISSLEKSISLAREAGIAEQNIIIDPGIGFGKSVEQNLAIIQHLAKLKVLNKPVLLESSRKFKTTLALDQRLEAMAVTVAIVIAHGADVERVHGVWQTVQVCRISDAIIRRKLDEF